MRTLKQPSLKLKAVLLSNDCGRTWVVSRQYYLTNLETNGLMNESLQGIFLTQTQEKNEHDQPTVEHI